jgi:hypothetical protein
LWVDNFLLTHKVRDFLFDIGPKLSPIGIRDQMLRGFLMAERALAAGLIGPDKPLLIVGAGAAGATTALVASQRGVPTFLIDLADEPFNRQLPSTRFIDPTQYDWPADHWDRRVFPWAGVALPFGWTAEFAASIAAGWKANLIGYAQHKNNPTLLLGWELEDASSLKDRDVDLTGGQLEVYFREVEGGLREGPHRFAVVVSCVGPGMERCFVGSNKPSSYMGVGFWEPDMLDAPNFGLPEGTRPKLLVSGAGDGALQDFLRIMTTCDSAGELFAELPEEIRREVADAVRTAEDQCQRGYLWNASVYDCRSTYLLHKKYHDIPSRLLEKKMDLLRPVLGKVLRGVRKGRLGKVHTDFDFEMIHPCGHFTNCYGLNRFLVLLVSGFLEREFDLDLITAFRLLLDVANLGDHDCSRQHDEGLTPDERMSAHLQCLRSEHTLEIGAPARCEHVKDSRGLRRDSIADAYNLIIIRHGVIPPSHLFGEAPNSNPRHTLPYYLDLDWYERG